MPLKGKRQIERRVVINAQVDVVWGVLSDSRLLPEWVPAVEKVTACSQVGEGVGSTRSCTANLAGKSGTMVERCVEYTPMARIAYLVDDESFGMGKMFNDYGFALNLDRQDSSTTVVTLQTHYTPRNLAFGALNAVMIRRNFRQVCEGILDGLKVYSEGAQNTL